MKKAVARTESFEAFLKNMIQSNGLVILKIMDVSSVYGWDSAVSQVIIEVGKGAV
ncbi:hypothetical protein JNA71_20130 [Bacillus halotolerans]|nr:hypothetical protein [Bacillus halotolerans]